MSPEFFVVASSLTLGCVLVLLTVLTQLQVDAGTSLTAAWSSFRLAVYSCLRTSVGWRGREAAGPDKTTSHVGRSPGRKARRTERRRQRRALLESHGDHELKHGCHGQSGEPQTNSTPLSPRVASSTEAHSSDAPLSVNMCLPN